MKKRFLFVSLLAALVLAACGAAAAPEASDPGYVEFEAAATEAPAQFQDSAALPAESSGQEGEAKSLAENGVVYETSGGTEALIVERMVIKSGEIRLLVKNSDVALDSLTQMVGDVGGYIVSSQVWYAEYNKENFKYANITIAVPSDQFETALRRLRNLSIRVLTESASGEDVTDQYVDLQSELVNLEATRDRIKTFLDQAQNVDEALRINQQLSEIEAQIEQVKGRMNYLKDRASFSTIAVSIEPELPPIPPTPTPTLAPTATPIAWDPHDTLKESKETLTSAYQGIIDFFIWFGIVIVPILLPPALVVWLLWKLLRRKPKA
ncbi:MAG: DUF4349 domain-containing protein [Chloroflexi bacterium]|nr:DUF4349 domain-containing protein [Chloroflexota bacterium]